MVIIASLHAVIIILGLEYKQCAQGHHAIIRQENDSYDPLQIYSRIYDPNCYKTVSNILNTKHLKF